MAPHPPTHNQLVADYHNERDSAEFRHPLGPIAIDSPTAVRVSYLGSLRSSVTALQEEINTFLTKKMEEDRLSSTKPQSVDDRQEEENYGEEVVDEA